MITRLSARIIIKFLRIWHKKRLVKTSLFLSFLHKIAVISQSKSTVLKPCLFLIWKVHYNFFDILAVLVFFGSMFEINTGAMTRKYRTTPYPSERLLHLIKGCGNGIVLSSDSHQADTLTFAFTETRKFLKDFGVKFVYTLDGGEFIKEYL